MRDEFLITRQGKQYVLYAGLLDHAHSRGLRSIDTQLLQVPDKSNEHVAVVKATVEMEDGRRFSGIGDASPANTNRPVAAHLLRMAETRAKARALRDAVNVGATALEELSDSEAGNADEQPPASPPEHPPRQQPRPRTPRHNFKARTSQVDLLKTLAVERRGPEGVKKLEGHVGKPIEELIRAEADDLIDMLTPYEEAANG